MQRRGIPYNVKKPADILKEPLIGQFFNILEYLEIERKKTFDGEELLFELMHSPYFGIAATDIAQLALYMQHSRKDKGPVRWRLLLANVLYWKVSD